MSDSPAIVVCIWSYTVACAVYKTNSFPIYTQATSPRRLRANLYMHVSLLSADIRFEVEQHACPQPAALPIPFSQHTHKTPLRNLYLHNVHLQLSTCEICSCWQNV